MALTKASEERIKLKVHVLGSLSSGLLLGGVLAPIAALALDAAGRNVDYGVVAFFFVICTLCAMGLYFMAVATLEELDQ